MRSQKGGSVLYYWQLAGVAEQADARDSKSRGATRVGSNPTSGMAQPGLTPAFLSPGTAGAGSMRGFWRFAFSFLLGGSVGVAIGLTIGWVIAPVEYVHSPLRDLDEVYRADYTVMVATAFRQHRDPSVAIEQLRWLGETNIPQYVQELTETYISTGRSMTDIINLVALSEALGRLTPPMEPYRLPATQTPEFRGQ